MNNTLKWHLRNKCYAISGQLSQENALEAIKEWLQQKKQQYTNYHCVTNDVRYHFIEELIQEIKK